METNEWLARCAKRYQDVVGLTEDEAMVCAIATHEADTDGDFADEPEEAADEDLACWDNDGE